MIQQEIRFSTAIAVSPKEADVAIASIDANGSLGALNEYVLRECGYSEEDLPTSTQLTDGFYALFGNEKKTILFIVTVNSGSTADNLKLNLYDALSEHRGSIRGKTVWVPLMGTGLGGLTLEESYSIIADTINRFLRDNAENVEFIISIPNEIRASALVQELKLKDTSTSASSSDGDQEPEKGQRFFVAGSIWEGGDEQAPRFFEENIWENGYANKFTDIVNSIEAGDVVFLKSSYANNQISYLRIKGVGVVTENPRNGTLLKMNWLLKDIKVDIEGMGWYRNTIALVRPDDVQSLINAVGLVEMLGNKWYERRNTSLEEKVGTFNRSTIAALISDNIGSDDYLDVRKDVTAFAKIITSKDFKPPLAIALFGKWGSGKSFFMGQLTKAVSGLSGSNRLDLYCGGIAQIHFNAWSYLDANLWASIVTRIFEGLREYITKDNKAKKEKQKIEEDLSSKLGVTKQEINLLESQKESVEAEIKSLHEQRKKLAETIESNITEIKNSTLSDILKNIDDQFNAEEKIKEAIATNPTAQITISELKRIVPEKYWDNPDAAYEKIRSGYAFVRRFIRPGDVKTNLLWLIAILLIILGAPPLVGLIAAYFNNENFLLPQVVVTFLGTLGIIWRRIEHTYNDLQPVIASFWKIKEEYQSKVKEEVFAFDQKEKALRLSIEKNTSDLAVINEQLQRAEVAKADLEFRIKNALATEALYSFIEKRTNSEDYKKYLGIVSLIRQDFEILSSLFAAHIDESVDPKFREKFERPLQRIILYIDDLDRCPEDRVVEVLEAVNLLMAFPLFIVVVGVDPRWIKNALLKKYNVQFGNNGNSTSTQMEFIEASNYLEKIFQVPFHLKEASDKSVRHMIKTLSGLKQRKEDSDGHTTKDGTSVAGNGGTPGGLKSDTSKVTPVPTPQASVVNASATALSEHLVLSDREVDLLQDFTSLIGNNPRAIKRFVNIYQIARAHEELQYFPDDEETEFLVVMFLLALSIGPFRKLTKSLREFIDDPSKEELTLSSFLDATGATGELAKLKTRLNATLSGQDTLSRLQQVKIETYNHHNMFVERFTFDN